MPSPIGHALAGAAVALAADIVDPRPGSTRLPKHLPLACALLATLPDLDLVVVRYHRSATHSLVAVVLVFIIAAAVTGRVRLRSRGLKASSGETRRSYTIACVCAAAWASHLMLDMMGADTLRPIGIQLLWPFSDRFFITGWDIFDQTERRHPLESATLRQNARAIAKEIALLGPIAIGLWLVRVKTLTRFAPKLAGRHHPAE